MTTDEGGDPADIMQIFDDLDGHLACRVCGALVPAGASYARIHWDWHEAANGA